MKGDLPLGRQQTEEDLMPVTSKALHSCCNCSGGCSILKCYRGPNRLGSLSTLRNRGKTDPGMTNNALLSLSYLVDHLFIHSLLRLRVLQS